MEHETGKQSGYQLFLAVSDTLGGKLYGAGYVQCFRSMGYPDSVGGAVSGKNCESDTGLVLSIRGCPNQRARILKGNAKPCPTALDNSTGKSSGVRIMGIDAYESGGEIRMAEKITAISDTGSATGNSHSRRLARLLELPKA